MSASDLGFVLISEQVVASDLGFVLLSDHVAMDIGDFTWWLVILGLCYFQMKWQPVIYDLGVVLLSDLGFQIKWWL